MKDIINYYYNFNIKEINDYKYYSSFNYLNDDFYFVFYNRSEKDLSMIVDIIMELKNMNIKVHDIVLNRDNKILTKINNNNYILLKVNDNKSKIISINDMIVFNNKLKLINKKYISDSINWPSLWSNKIDYFEYQIKEIGKDKSIILDSFSYYIGLAENAISYVNKINKTIEKSEYDNITLSHRRIFIPNYSLNYLNPLSFIFDLNVRDIAEYLKASFFKNENSLLDLKTYLKQVRLTPYSYHMLYARLLYPSYYFDIYEDIMNNNGCEERLINIIDKVKDYEIFLKDAYYLINNYTKLEKIDWIIKKEN